MDSPGLPPTVARSEERFADLRSGVRICFQTFGRQSDPALLLVMGLGGPMNWWDAEFCERLARAGFFVVRYDNRDCGRSSYLDAVVTRPMLVRAFLGLPTTAPYSISDMAADGMELLDAIGVGDVHVVGVSMGGMIAQTMAIEYPDRVRSLTSISSTTGRRSVGRQHPKVLPALLTDRTTDRAAYVEGTVRFGPLIGSPAYPEDPARARLRAQETWDRTPGGVKRAATTRQMLAVLTQPDRTRSLDTVKVPTLVVHGNVDPLVGRSGGAATARAVPGATTMTVAGMGHDLPRDLWDTLVTAIHANATGLPV